MRKLFLVCFLFISFSAKAQEINLEELIKKAEKSVINYVQTFKNLSADEKKDFKYYKKDGNIDESRIIKSTLIIYQPENSRATYEFRNPLEYNSKSVAKSDEKIGDFFEKLAKAKNDSKILNQIRSESERYDGFFKSYGVTLNPVTPLFELRPFFEFKIIGKDKIEGREVFIVEYVQTKPTLLYKVNATNEELKQEPRGTGFNGLIPNKFRPTNPRMSGKLWLDANTGQIWRNQFKIVINPAILNHSVDFQENDYQYQSSQFGILVPKSARNLNYKIEGDSDKNLRAFKYADRYFEYSNFASVASEIKKYEVGK